MNKKPDTAINVVTVDLTDSEKRCPYYINDNGEVDIKMKVIRVQEKFLFENSATQHSLQKQCHLTRARGQCYAFKTFSQKNV
jgi:hypothetical protein